MITQYNLSKYIKINNIMAKKKYEEEEEVPSMRKKKSIW
jgi:hypothetical protein